MQIPANVRQFREAHRKTFDVSLQLYLATNSIINVCGWGRTNRAIQLKLAGKGFMLPDKDNAGTADLNALLKNKVIIIN